ncbi:MAG: exodeoxyribonuclease VII large subunit [Candidatus Stygibacter australis]|nr:exodeoxyribonuclease VII large subunit [Candidatus Stygibacter australis]MDP8322984.1 exodeoxyribonuclease VII large subunit [Candidatus Stygibacter australis]
MQNFFPVSAVTKRIKDYLAPAMATEFWVRGELYNVSNRGGHYYGSLIETDTSGRTVAKVEIRLWSGQFQSIRRKFQQAGMELKMTSGMQYGFLCKLTFHNTYGLALEIKDADPQFNLGEMERRRQEIINKLKSENRFEMNKRVPLTFLPQKIGLITSGSSAAYSDFMKTLNSSPWGFIIYLADARMQGDATEDTVLKALEVLRQLDLDLVVITRGGGSKSDLYSLDNLKIALAISEYPLPVWTGIGHEIDTSVLDYVAHTSFKTPTAVAEHLVARYDTLKVNLDNFQDRLYYHWQKEYNRNNEAISGAVNLLRSAPRYYLQQLNSRLNQTASRLQNTTLMRLKRWSLLLNSFIHKLRSYPDSRLQQFAIKLQYQVSSFQLFKYIGLINEQSRKLKDYRRLLKANDPLNNLRKGYTIVYDQQKKIIRSVHDISAESEITTRFSDGEISSKVNIIKENKNDKADKL